MSYESFVEPTILYVDDQPSHLALFKKAFQGDYLVLTAASPEEGLKILNDYEIFLVIADHNMPQMTGVDFLEKAQAVNPRAQQAILSAYLNDEIIQESARRTKVYRHLRKPWKLDQMRNFLHDALKSFEIKTPSDGEILEPTLEKKTPISLHQLANLAGSLESSVDPRGARRIFLRYVEPPIKRFVPLIHRPVSELLHRAQDEALKGHVENFQKILASYLVEASSNDSSDSDTRIIN